MTVLESIGVGFGPSNIALAIALEERGMIGTASGHLFFDVRTEPDWHPGLMYEEATMQISFLKDLITMVNPQSTTDAALCSRHCAQRHRCASAIRALPSAVRGPVLLPP